MQSAKGHCTEIVRVQIKKWWKLPWGVKAKRSKTRSGCWHVFMYAHTQCDP